MLASDRRYHALYFEPSAEGPSSPRASGCVLSRAVWRGGYKPEQRELARLLGELQSGA